MGASKNCPLGTYLGSMHMSDAVARLDIEEIQHAWYYTWGPGVVGDTSWLRHGGGLAYNLYAPNPYDTFNQSRYMTRFGSSTGTLNPGYSELMVSNEARLSLYEPNYYWRTKSVPYENDGISTPPGRVTLHMEFVFPFADWNIPCGEMLLQYKLGYWSPSYPPPGNARQPHFYADGTIFRGAPKLGLNVSNNYYYATDCIPLNHVSGSNLAEGTGTISDDVFLVNRLVSFNVTRRIEWYYASINIGDPQECSRFPFDDSDPEHILYRPAYRAVMPTMILALGRTPRPLDVGGSQAPAFFVKRPTIPCPINDRYNNVFLNDEDSTWTYWLKFEIVEMKPYASGDPNQLELEIIDLEPPLLVSS